MKEKKSYRSGEAEIWLKSGDGLIAAFLVPIIIMIIIFLQRGIFPFGEESFMRTDMYHQYVPFFSEFKHKLSQEGSLFYSWNVGMGINFSALYAYYLASPMNWLILLVPKKYVIEFITYMIVFKIGLSGLSFAYYLKKHSEGTGFGIAFFGIFYALSGYMAAYSWNIMWLDCILLFPIVCLGLERLVAEKKGMLYSISLGICISSNYYISIMICSFMILFFLMRLILEKKRGVKDFFASVFYFTFYSLLAGGISAIILLPEIYALQSTASGEFNFPKSFSSYFSIIDMFARHIGNVKTEIGLEHWPNIYCGVAVFLFLFLYLYNRRIGLKEKAVYLTACLFLLASFSVNVLNYMWHGFHYPNSLPARQSFIYIFLVLYMGFRVYDRFDGNRERDIGKALLASIGFVLLCQKFVEQTHFHFAVYYAAMFFLGIYALLMYLHKKRLCNPNVLLFLLLGIVSAEAAVNTVITSVTTTSRSAYIEDNEDVRTLLSQLPNDLGDFYRFDKVSRKTKDDGAWLNFHSVSLFSSTASADMSDFFKKIGCESSTNAYSITGATPLIDCLFAVKYGIYSQQPGNEQLNYLSYSGETYLYENPYVLSLGYMLPAEFESRWQLDIGNPAEVQNDFAAQLGAAPVLDKVAGTASGSRYSFNAYEKGEYYVYIANPNVDNVLVTIGESRRSLSFEHTKRGFLLDLGICEENEEVVLTTDDEESLDAMVYRFNYDSLEHIYQMLSKNNLLIREYRDTYINADLNIEEGGVLMTSIPYDKGWKIMVDAQKREAKKGFGSFIALDMEPGIHRIEMFYEPEGFARGGLISLASVLILAGSALIGALRKMLKELREQREVQEWEEEEDEEEERKEGEESPDEANEAQEDEREAEGLNEEEEAAEDEA